MEQNSSTPTPSQGGKVMDVQAPAGQMPGTSDVKLAPSVPVASAASPTPPPQQAPTAAPARQPASPAPETEQALHTPSKNSPPQIPKKKKPKGPIVVIVVACIVLASLVGLAVLMYMQGTGDVTNTNQNNETAQPNSQPNNGQITPEQAIDQATTSVDETIKEIDKSSGADSHEISDDTLGL